MKNKETENQEIVNYNVWFTSDLHILHKNILHHQPKRIELMGLKDKDDIEGHAKYIIDLWLNTVKRHDHVYVLGDMIFSSQQDSIKVLHKLKSTGCHIHLIVGNHDKSIQRLYNMFDSIDLIKVVDFKKSNFPFLEENISITMCHYPMKSWPRKAHGGICCHGHTHDNSPWENDGSDLEVNVGFDAELAEFNLISLEKLYGWYKKKLNGLSPKDYIQKVTDEDPTFIR